MLNEYIDVLFYILIGEGVVLLVLVFSVVTHRIFLNIYVKREQKRQELLMNYFLGIAEKKVDFDVKTFPGKGRWTKSNMVVLEEYQNTVMGEEWDVLRKQVTETFLLKKARKWARSHTWSKRNYAGRIFKLNSLPCDEELLLKLMDDSHFLVKAPVAFALVRQESVQGVSKILRGIQKEKGYGQYIYRDALLEGSESVFHFLNDYAVDPSKRLEVLDVLSGKSWGKPVTFLEEELKSKDPEIYFLAIKVLIRNPLPNSATYFKLAARSSDPRVRAIAMKGVGIYQTEESNSILEAGLKDNSWDVRIEAGKMLREMGEAGVNILNNQQEQMAKEAAQYVLQFG